MSEAPASAPAGFNLLGADALFAPMPPVDWLCQSLRIAPGAPTLFAGYGYSGKSIALQSLALSVASGRPLWGKWAVKRGRVLHLDYEQGRRLTSERYQRMAFGMEPRFLQLEAGILPSSPLNADNLCWSGEGRTLVLVDSWRAAHPNVDENSSEVRKTLDVMGVASEKTGATFIMLIHARKPQKDSGSGGGKYSIRGSSGFFDGAQTIYLFDGEQVGAPVVSLEKDRLTGGDLDPFRLRFVDTEGGGLDIKVEEMDGKMDAAVEYAKTMNLVRAFIKARPGTNASEIAEVLGKRSQTINAIVGSLANTTPPEIVIQGKARSTRIYMYGSEPRGVD